MLKGCNIILKKISNDKQRPLDLKENISNKKFIQKLIHVAALIIAMSGKSLDHYIAALSEVKVLIPEFDPIIGIADFEIAQRLGAQEIFLHLLGKN